MRKYRIFVSGVQKELANERQAVKDLVSENILLKEHFSVFLFEDQPARGKPASKTYIKEVNKSDIYIGIFGNIYGSVGSQGLSATESEFRQAQKQSKEILIYLQGRIDSERDKRLKKLINEIKKSESGYVYKRFNNTLELKNHIFESLVIFLKDKGIVGKTIFDFSVCEEATYKDIREELVKDFLTNRSIKRKVDIPKTSIKDFLQRTIKVLRKIDGVFKPTNTAILFFCDYPQEFISQSSIKIARFRGNTRIEFIDSKELIGPFYKILDDAEGFFKRNTRLANKIVEFKRVDIPEYPFEAIREAVINAMAHRDYNRIGSNIQIDIFDDRIEVTSPGRLLPGLNIKNLEGVHETRNKEICKIFHETKDMEKYGTGITKMNKWMQDNGLKPPVFGQPGDFFRVIFYGPGEKILDLVYNIPEERQTDLKELGLNERQIEALRVMVNESQTFTNRKYRDVFKVTNKTAANDLNTLVKKGMAQVKGKGRSTVYLAN